MKKIFLLFFLLLGVLSAWAYDAKVNGIYYNLDTKNKTASVAFGGGVKGAVVIPESIEVGGTTYSVTSLGEGCFKRSNLTSITIPNSVTSLGDECFRECSGLTSITIPNSVTSLGDECFRECSGLTNITIPNSVTSLEYACFRGCSGLTSITIPNSVTSLGDNCFDGCSGLTSITIPNSVTSLGTYCFRGCSGLTSITIPNSVTSLYACFADCSGLESIVVESGNTVYDSRENCNAIIKTKTKTMLSGCKNTIIPNSVTSLEDDCFYGCSGLTSITIPNSVTSLGDRCFFGCSGLTSITIPNSVTSLGVLCFERCPGLESIVVESGNTVYDSRENCNAIIETKTKTMLSGCKNTIIPNSVTSLGNSCFYGCSGLTSITIPNSVTSLGDDCFYDCSGLTEVHVNRETPPTTGKYIFEACESLQTIYVPIGASANYEVAPWNAYEIVEEDVQSGIREVMAEGAANAPVYHLNGQRAGTSKNFSTLPKGIYIVNVKKVLR